MHGETLIVPAAHVTAKELSPWAIALPSDTSKSAIAELVYTKLRTHITWERGEIGGGRETSGGAVGWEAELPKSIGQNCIFTVRPFAVFECSFLNAFPLRKMCLTMSSNSAAAPRRIHLHVI